MAFVHVRRPPASLADADRRRHRDEVRRNVLWETKLGNRAAPRTRVRSYIAACPRRPEEPPMPSAAVVERRTKAVELVGAGMSYDEVAAELGYANRSGAWKAVQASLKAVQAETVDEYRALSLDRLEALLAQVWDKAMAGDVNAVAAARRIVDAECRVLGLV